MSRAAAVVVMALALVRAVSASERSERLVAGGELAYETGHTDEARTQFADAVAADPADAVARYHLGVALAKLERWDEAVDAFAEATRLRPGFEPAQRALAYAREHARAATARAGAAKRWQLRGTTGVGYDTNVQVSPGGRFAGLTGETRDTSFILGGGGQYDLVRRSDALVRLEYDLYQTLHPDIDTFDFRSHRVGGTASYRLWPALWGGLRAGYDHDTLGGHGYLSEPWVLPFVSLLEGERGVTTVSYRHGEATYLTRPFHDLRDGPEDAVAANEVLSFGPRSLTFGYEYAEERPRSARGNDYALASHGGQVALDLPAWWRTTVDLAYGLRYDGYTEPNSFAGFRKQRHDLVHELHAGVMRPLGEHVSAGVLYYGTLESSNIALFAYRRHMVSGVLQFTY